MVRIFTFILLLLPAFCFTAEIEKKDTFDLLKEISLGKNSSVTLGGHIRVRGEQVTGFRGNSDEDDEYLLSRLFLYSDFHLGKIIRFFLEGKSAFVMNRKIGLKNDDPFMADDLDIQQAFAELTFYDQMITLRGGRQELNLGSGRLLHEFSWNNVQISWDGISAHFQKALWTLDLFNVWGVEIKKGKFNKTDEDLYLGGIHLSAQVHEHHLMDGYVYFRQMDALEDRTTIGMHLHSTFWEGRLFMDLEGAWQTGAEDDQAGGRDIRAYMASLQAGWKFDVKDWDPVFRVGIDFATGTGDGSDQETFDPLYPNFHEEFGITDMISRRNILALYLTFSAQPVKDKFRFEFSAYFYKKAEKEDSLYGVGFTLPSNGEDKVGTELDFHLIYRYNRYLLQEAGFGHFFADEDLSDDMEFIYTQFLFQF